MGKVTAQFTMSLDGFIAGPNDDVGRLFGWYRGGDTDFPLPATPLVFKISRASAEYLHQEWGALGAIVTGRHDFDVSEAYGGAPPLALPMFIVTHRIPQEWVKPDSPFTFVTEGVTSAIEQAQKAAGSKVVGVGGTTIVRQCLQAGLLDEILIDLAPILLGAGTRLFDQLGVEPINLEKLSVINAPDVTYLKFRIIK
jgi:dihydrofolate reductase